VSRHREGTTKLVERHEEERAVRLSSMTDAEKLEHAELMARLCSRDAPELQAAVIYGKRGGEVGYHVIYDEVRADQGERLFSIFKNGCCLLRARSGPDERP